MLERITTPAALVTVGQVKAALRLRHSDDDNLIEDIIGEATAYLDGHSGIIGRALVSQQWNQTFPCFAPVLRLGIDPLINVDAVKYHDGDNIEQTLDPATYYSHSDDKSPYIKPHTGMSFPSVYLRDDAVTVTMTVGFGAPEEVPANLVAAVKMVACHLYENPEATSEDEVFEVSIGVKDLIATHKRYL